MNEGTSMVPGDDKDFFPGALRQLAELAEKFVHGSVDAGQAVTLAHVWMETDCALCGGGKFEMDAFGDYLTDAPADLILLNPAMLQRCQIEARVLNERREQGRCLDCGAPLHGPGSNGCPHPFE
jgi:hypothetical protein